MKKKIEERIKMQNEMENITKPVSQQQNPTKKIDKAQAIESNFKIYRSKYSMCPK